MGWWYHEQPLGSHMHMGFPQMNQAAAACTRACSV
jgi:hypothetical protein